MAPVTPRSASLTRVVGGDAPRPRASAPLSGEAGDPAAPLLTIVIASWNTRDLLRACMSTIEAERRAMPGVEIETMVADNASSDGTCEMLEEEYPQAILIRNPSNLGFAAATNQGLRRARGRYALMLNPDTEMSPGALSGMIEFMEQTPAAGAAGACLVNADGSLQASASPAPGLLREAWRLFHLDRLIPFSRYPLQRWAGGPARVVDVAQGACLILRRSALEQVGLLDEGYFMYTEEVDLCCRLRRQAWSVYWLPGVKVLHHGGQSTRQQQAEMFLRLYESKVRYFRKHHGRLGAFAYKLILGGAALPRLMAGPLGRLRASARRAEEQRTAEHYRALLKALPNL